MKKIRKLNILLAIILCILCLSKSEVFSMSQEDAGKHIANYAINFWEKNANNVVYDMNRSAAINGQTLSDGCYHMDCVGFTAMVINQALPEFKGNGRPSICAPYWDDPNEFWWPGLAENVVNRVTQNDIANLAQEGKIMPGDIIANWHHVMIYVGNGKIIHCRGTPLSNEGILEYKDGNPNGGNWWGVCRIRADLVASFTQFNDGGDIHDLGSSGGFLSGIRNKLNQFVAYVCDKLLPNENEDIPKGTPVDKDDFYYKGIADVKGVKKVEKEDEKENSSGFVFPKISEFADWVINAMTFAIKGVFVGWTNIVQLGVSEYVASASGEETQLSLDKFKLDNLDQLNQTMKESLTLQKIVYNQVPVFDVNVFSTKAGGKEVKSGSLTETVRKLTANWYYIIRTVSIIALLLVFIYLGIRAAISSVAEDKAVFKGMLINWLIAFIMVFFMHYLILFILLMNETFVGIFAKIGGDLNLYETIRELTWHPKNSVSFLAMLIYICLVYYLIKFVILYFRRLFITILLIIIAPFIGAKFAYDKIKKDSNDSSYGKWFKEFTFSVFMQTIHALVYTVFVTIIIDMTLKSGEGMVFAKFLIAFLFFHFMTKAESILRDLFKLKASKGTDFGSVATMSFGTFVGASTIYKVIGKNAIPMYEYSKEYLNEKINNKEIGFLGVGLLARGINKVYRGVTDTIEQKYVEARKDQLHKKGFLDIISEVRENTDNKGNDKKLIIDEKLDQALREEYHMRKSAIGNLASTLGKTVGGMAQTFAGIPVFLTESPIRGGEWILAGLHTVMHAAGEPIKGYRTEKTGGVFKVPKKAAKNAAALVATISTAGGYNIIKNMKQVYGQRFDILFKDKRPEDINYPFKPEQIKLLIQAEELEKSISKKLEDIKKFEFNGNSAQMQIAIRDLINEMEKYQYIYNRIDIKEYIKDYRKEIGKYSLDLDDMVEIANRTRKTDKNEIDNQTTNTQELKDTPTNKEEIKEENSNNELEHSIQSQVKMNLLEDITNSEQERREEHREVYEKMMDELQENMKNLIHEEEVGGANNETKKNATQLAIYLLAQKQGSEEISKALENIKVNTNENIDNSDNSDLANSEENDEPIKEMPRNRNIQTIIDRINGVETQEEQRNINQENNISSTNSKDESDYKPQSLKEILDKLRDGSIQNVDINNLNKNDKKEVENALEDVINKEIINDTLATMDADELTSVMKKSIDSENKKNIKRRNPLFGNILDDINKLFELNDKMIDITSKTVDKKGNITEKEGEPIYTKNEIIDIIRSGNKEEN